MAASPNPHQAALEQYRRRASVCDVELALFEPIRRSAIARLGLKPGDTVSRAGGAAPRPVHRRACGDCGLGSGCAQNLWWPEPQADTDREMTR